MKFACRRPRQHADFDPLLSLANVAITDFVLVHRLLVRGHSGSFYSIGQPPKARGVVAVSPSAFWAKDIVGVWGLAMRFERELTIGAAWRIVASGHEQWERTGSIESEHLATVRKVQIDMAQHLARFEDGPAVLFTSWNTRCQLRHIEQMASDLICLSDQCTTSCASGAG